LYADLLKNGEFHAVKAEGLLFFNERDKLFAVLTAELREEFVHVTLTGRLCTDVGSSLQPLIYQFLGHYVGTIGHYYFTYRIAGGVFTMMKERRFDLENFDKESAYHRICFYLSSMWACRNEFEKYMLAHSLAGKN